MLLLVEAKKKGEVSPEEAEKEKAKEAYKEEIKKVKQVWYSLWHSVRSYSSTSALKTLPTLIHTVPQAINSVNAGMRAANEKKQSMSSLSLTYLICELHVPLILFYPLDFEQS